MGIPRWDTGLAGDVDSNRSQLTVTLPHVTFDLTSRRGDCSPKDVPAHCAQILIVSAKKVSKDLHCSMGAHPQCITDPVSDDAELCVILGVPEQVERQPEILLDVTCATTPEDQSLLHKLRLHYRSSMVL